MATLHINQISPTEAQRIAPAKLLQDDYHHVIQAGARYLCRRGCGAWQYVTQWAEFDDDYVIITRQMLTEDGFQQARNIEAGMRA